MCAAHLMCSAVHTIAMRWLNRTSPLACRSCSESGSWRRARRARVGEYFLLADATLSERVRAAFLAVPRHGFVPRYRDFGSDVWHEVGDDIPFEHLPILYRDDAIAIGVDAVGDVVTITGPGWVLYMLELLQIEPGQRAFEVGAGSGWNAALLG